MIVFSHPTCNANAREAALGLEEDGLLEEFWTCVGWSPEWEINAVIPKPARTLLMRRSLPESIRKRAHYLPGREIGRLICGRYGILWPMRHETGVFSVDAVYQSLDRKVASRLTHLTGLSAVYAFEDGAESTFSEAKRRGMSCIYDLPIGYWRSAQSIYEEEADREPEWATTLTGRFDSAHKLARKEREIEMANVVVVASSFTKQTLKVGSHSDKQVEVLAYGSPAPVDDSRIQPIGRRSRVLFVGSLGQRKGISYLLRAMQLVGSNAELTLIGRKTQTDCLILNEGIRPHRWIPSLSHDGILAEMRNHDILVFPSLFEGFGLVILEAMSQGVPVITTPNTAGPDIIEDGVDGFIVPIRSAESIAARIDQLCTDHQRLLQMKHAAREKALTYSWQRYRKSLAFTLRRFLEGGAASLKLESRKQIASTGE